ncbi:hypothetical protein [Nostoc sphaeroides]|nr:hypothetical protein [Nostoc sphaeroides]
MTVHEFSVNSQQSTVNDFCYCSLLTVDGSRVFSQQSTVNSQRL